MPYKDIEKQRAANRKSYHKYWSERNKRIALWIKNNPEKRLKINRNHGWKRVGIKNPDGTRFMMTNYEQLFKKQNGKCAIKNCLNQPSDFKRIFDVDHNHTTKIVRGLLCASDNKILGHVNDSIVKLQRLINYLELHKSGGEKQL